MKKIYRIIALLLAVLTLTACGGEGASDSVKLDPEAYVTDEKMITIADMPPNPFDPEAVQLYKDMGFTHWILTEDHVAMVEDGTLSDGYKQAIDILTEQGFEIWIRNMQNDPQYFQIETEKTGSNYGTPYTLAPRDITDDFLEYENVTGFYMMDEPFQNTLEDDPATEDNESLHPALDQLDTLIQWKNEYYPDEIGRAHV